MPQFDTDEAHTSQLPALQLLLSCGYSYISHAEVMRQRKGKLSNVILEDILNTKLQELNCIQYKGQTYSFTDSNIEHAIQKLKNVHYDGLVKTNEEVFKNYLDKNISIDQTIEGVSRGRKLRYIDWENPKRNAFHVALEFSVERSKSSKTVRPDIVLFVNGIPFCVIECKSPSVEVEQAISQNIRNQGETYIPKLFTYSQMVLAVNKNKARYATTGTKAKFWSTWKEKSLNEGEKEHAKLQTLVNTPIEESLLADIAKDLTLPKISPTGDRIVTEQDKAIYALCRPERLLELTHKYTVFDKGIKKIARYQQYFVVKSALQRVKQVEPSGERKGGVIWHTQGSGKSLTMVMLARNLKLDQEIVDPRIVLVTDRTELDGQLHETFIHCNMEAQRSKSGRHLLQLVKNAKAGIVTAVVHKFENAYTAEGFSDESSNIFVLVDESHRTQFGEFSARMRQFFPNASYIGFTGTPLLKREKNNFAKFGKLIDPHYSINQAVEDGAVVPLLYEGRLVDIDQNKLAIDRWFEQYTKGLSQSQQADLKRKYARAEMLNKSDQVVYMQAFDISEHYRKTWQGTGFKGQLVAPDKATAIKYKKCLDDLGDISSEVIISAPDMREGFESPNEEAQSSAVQFWGKMMEKYGDEEEYKTKIINGFKGPHTPEILIVVDKLLTGFDAPTNTVLYLCRTLREHTLLQAIARVNRIHENKEFGYIIDYANVLGELDQALTMYGAFEGFDEADIAGALASINTEIEKLEPRHSELWEIFKTVKHTNDVEAYERLLEDKEQRDNFYEKLATYAKTLAIALSSDKFLKETTENRLEQYKSDLRRFRNLRKAVSIRYADSIDYGKYEPKIRKLLDTHIQANDVEQLNAPVNIFDDDTFEAVKEEQGIYGASKAKEAQADTIANKTLKTINIKMEEDPAFYEKFSKLIQDAINDFRAQKLTALEYLQKAKRYESQVENREHENIPESLLGNEDAIAYYGNMHELLKNFYPDNNAIERIASDIGKFFDEALRRHYKIHFWNDSDAVNDLTNELEDYLYDTISSRHNIDLNDHLDDIINRLLKIARYRCKD